MADPPPPPPVAIRITRPYETEDEYLAQELDMVSRTSITLVGAQPRPQGVVLRFELVLSGGQVLVRGEGRVVAFKPNALRGVGGLTLRFTRIDARSKGLLDKATALREARRPSSKPPMEPEAVPLSPPPAAKPAGPAALETTVFLALTPPSGSAGVATLAEPPPSPPKPAEPARPSAPRPDGTMSRRERDSLLERLRARGKSLEPDAVRRILEKSDQNKSGTA